MLLLKLEVGLCPNFQWTKPIVNAQYLFMDLLPRFLLHSFQRMQSFSSKRKNWLENSSPWKRVPTVSHAVEEHVLIVVICEIRIGLQKSKIKLLLESCPISPNPISTEYYVK